MEIETEMEPCSATACPAILEVHLFIECATHADAAKKLRGFANEIEKAGIPSDAREMQTGYSSGCNRLLNRKEWHFIKQNDQDHLSEP